MPEPDYYRQIINFYTDCMSLSFDYRTLRNGKSYTQNLHPKMSVNAENYTDAPAVCGSEGVDEPITGFSPDRIEEKIKANLEPLNA